MTTEWYRTADWSGPAQDDFERRLSRARAYSRPQYVYLKAASLSEAGHDLPAITLWERVVAEYPDSIDVAASLEALGDAARRAGRNDDALRYYRMILEHSPDLNVTSGMVEVSMAEILIEQGDEASLLQAIELLNSALQRKPHLDRNLFRWHVALLRASEQRGDTETQQRAAKTALELARRGPQYPRHPTVGLVDVDDAVLAWLEARASGRFWSSDARPRDRKRPSFFRRR